MIGKFIPVHHTSGPEVRAIRAVVRGVWLFLDPLRVERRVIEHDVAEREHSMIGLQFGGVLLKRLEVGLEVWIQGVLVEQGISGPGRSQCLRIDMIIFRRWDV